MTVPERVTGTAKRRAPVAGEDRRCAAAGRRAGPACLVVADAVAPAAVAGQVIPGNAANLTQAVHDAIWLPVYPDVG
jgi:hypothetical protein